MTVSHEVSGKEAAKEAGRAAKRPRLGPAGWLFERYADGSFVALPYGLESTIEQAGTFWVNENVALLYRGQLPTHPFGQNLHVST